MNIPKNATCQNDAERDQTGKIKTMFSICVACERPGANTWRRKICIFCKLEEKPCVENRRITKKKWFNQKKTRKPSNCVIAVLNMFLPKNGIFARYMFFSSYLWLVFAIYISSNLPSQVLGCLGRLLVKLLRLRPVVKRHKKNASTYFIYI